MARLEHCSIKVKARIEGRQAGWDNWLDNQSSSQETGHKGHGDPHDGCRRIEHRAESHAHTDVKEEEQAARYDEAPTIRLVSKAPA